MARISGRWWQYLTDPRARRRLIRYGAIGLIPLIMGGAGIAFVQEVAIVHSTTANSTTTGAQGATFTPGNLVAIIVGWSNSGTVMTSIDVPSGLTAPLASKANGAPNGISRAYYLLNNPGGAQTWTWNVTQGGGTATSWAIHFVEFSGVDTATGIDLTTVNNATGASSSTTQDTTAASGTTQSGDVVIMLIAAHRNSLAGAYTTDTTNSVPTSGWTVGTLNSSTGGTPNAHTSMQYNILSGTSTNPRGVTTHATTQSSEAWLLTFLPAAAPVGAGSFFLDSHHPGPR